MKTEKKTNIKIKRKLKQKKTNYLWYVIKEKVNTNDCVHMKINGEQ